MHGRAGSTERAGVVFMLASAFFFSLMSLQVKIVSRLPLSEIVLARALVSLAITAVALRRARISPWGTRRRRLLQRGLLGFAGLVCFFAAIGRLPLTDATVIHYLNPILTAVFAAIALGEGLSRRHVAALALSFSGLILVARPSALFGSGSLPLVGVGLGVLGATFAAAAYTTIRSLRDEPALVVVFYFPLVTVPLCLPWAAMHFVLPTAAECLLLIGIGVSTQIAQVALTRGLKALPAGPAMNIAYTQILFVGLWQAIFFGVLPSGLALVGAALVFAGTMIVTLGRTPGSGGLPSTPRQLP